ncbi:MAG: type I DNA topoisomerase [Bacteroidota bacterium]
MSYKLVIVESPVKATTISKYLGAGYQVASCNGHIRDLPQKELAIDVKNGFKPTYVINTDKLGLVEKLKKATHEAKEVLLATDDDREGEAISWHLTQALKLDQARTKRIFFREITKQAIKQALDHPREIDMDLVNAQQARRVLDRLVGYDISPILWKKIKTGLSAGRVQSVAVKLIVDKQRAIQAFVPVSGFRVRAALGVGKDIVLDAELTERIGDAEGAKSFLQSCVGAVFTIKELKKTTLTRKPSAPFTTSTLQQEASQKLGYSVSRAMRLAQQLYEQGHITYMRTDSTYLAKEALAQAKKTILAIYGPDYHTPRSYVTKSATAQEAHEAIRPTRFSAEVVSEDASLQRLYKLIWQRAMASQMTAAKIDKTTTLIGISTSEKNLVSQAEIIAFKGFLAAYQYEAEAGKASPKLAVGQLLSLNDLEAKECFTKPPSLYTEASLVRRLEEEGIGRPSTYAPTISTIQQRGYVIKDTRPGKLRSYRVFTLEKGKVVGRKEEENFGAAKNKLFPTDMALVVNDFLNEHFADITNYQFTAHVETKLDEIAQNKQNWQAMLSEFYQSFSPQIVKALAPNTYTPVTIRELGKDPKTGKPVLARISKRYGPLVQLGAMDADEKPRIASIPKSQFVESITLKDALKLLELPREVGDFEGEVIIAQIGRYGPYVKHQNRFYSLGKELSAYTIKLEEAVALIKAQREAEAKKIVKTFQKEPLIQLCQGRWGVYLKTSERNVKIPKGTDLEKLNLESCLALIDQAPAAKRKRATKQS